MALTIPGTHLGSWASEIIQECYASREQRRAQIKVWQSYFYTGTSDGSQSRYNRCYAHVDRLASYLFSPADVRFNIEFDLTDPKETQAQGTAASRYLNREFHRCGVDTAFSSANNWALVKGCTLVKMLWGHQGLEPWVVHPEFFGVLREDIEDLNRQEAFVHSTYMTPTAFERTIEEHPEKSEIMRKVTASASSSRDADEIEDSYLHQVVIGGMNQPVSTSGTSAGSGMVGITPIPQPQLARQVAAELIRLDELWVLDKKRGDWTTLRYVEPEIIVEGNLRHRNLSGVKGEHPFAKVCANEVDGYFWGMSEIAQIYKLQDLLNTQIRDITRLTRLKSAPPRVLIGFSGMTQEKYKVLNRPDGFIAEENPTAKLETLAPEIPSELFAAVEKTVQYFDDVAGFAPILTGQGEQGVRAGVHAQTLARNASPRMRDRALLVERQCVDVGDFCFKLLQEKEATVFDSEVDGGKFLLSQIPGDYRVTVDSHTSSPAFSEDNKQLAFQLARFGAIDPEDLIMLTHPPHEDKLILRAKQRAEAQAKLMREHPEMFEKKGRKK